MYYIKWCQYIRSNNLVKVLCITNDLSLPLTTADGCKLNHLAQAHGLVADH